MQPSRSGESQLCIAVQVPFVRFISPVETCGHNVPSAFIRGQDAVRDIHVELSLHPLIQAAAEECSFRWTEHLAPGIDRETPWTAIEV